MNAMLQTVRSMGGARLLSLIGVGTVLLIFFAFLSFRLATPVLSPMYTGLSQEDAADMVVELDALGATYQVSPDGKQIMVSSGDVSRLRLALAQKGLPSQGSIVGYEIFDKSDTLGTSSFVHNINMIRALEGELARTISSLDSISAARVHLVIPKRQLFTRNKVEPSASVVLTMRSRAMPSKEESAAVTHLVSTAVPGLKPNRITIVDNTGKLLARGGSEEDPGAVASNSQEYKAAFENRLKRMIETLLEQSVGVGRVKAEISAEIDFDRIVTNSEVYDPDGQVARSVQTTESIEKSSEQDATGAVGVVENLPDAGGSEAGASASNSVERVDETTNFEISKTMTNHVRESGNVKRISIAVLVDGTYNYEVEQNTEGEEVGKNVYVPRSDEELAQLRQLVESAVGYDPERGDTISIVNMQFSRENDDFVVEESAFDWLKRDFNSIIKTLVIGLVAVLAILLVIRPMVNRAFEINPVNESEELVGVEGAAQQFLEQSDEIDVDDIQSKVSESSAKKVTEIIDNNPEETLAVIRGWLSQK